jgi:hypothetical protein
MSKQQIQSTQHKISSVYDELNQNFIFDTFPKEDGWYKLKIYDIDNKRVQMNSWIQKCGTKLRLYYGEDDVSWVFFKEYSVCNITNKIMNTGCSEIQDRIIKVIKEKSKDATKFFLETFTSQKVVIDEDIIGVEGRGKRKKGKYIKSKSRGVTNIMVGKTDIRYNRNNGFLDLADLSDRNIVVKGPVQSGKSTFILFGGAWFAMNGKHTFVILRNSKDDEKQFLKRIDEFNLDIQEGLGDMSGQFEIVGVKNSDITLDMLIGKPKIFVTIGHTSPIERMNKIVECNPELNLKNNYALFIDEVDFQNGDKASKHIDELKKNALCVFGVSGTVMDTLLVEDIKVRDIIFMAKPDHYFDLASFKNHMIPEGAKLGTLMKDDMLVKDPNLCSFLEWFATSPLKDSDYFVKKFDEWHPRDYLFRVTTTHDSNHRLLSYISRRYPEIPAMFFSGDGTVALHLNEEFNRIVLPDGNTSVIKKLKTRDNKYTFPGMFHCFRHTSPAFVKQWLYENGGFKKYPRIITLAGDMAARAIGFGASNFSECKKSNKLWWHLTGMYVLTSKGMDQAEIQQMMGRLCVVKNDHLSLNLHATKKDSEDMIKAYKSQDEIIDKSIRFIVEQDKNLSIKDVLQIVGLSKEKVSNRRATKKDRICIDKNGNDRVFKVNIIKREEDIDSGGWDLKEYDVNFENNSDTIPIHEYNRLTKKMFPIWTNKTNKIGMFMHDLDPTKLYTEEEIGIYGIKSADIVVDLTGKPNKYGYIMCLKTDKFQMFPELVKEFKRYF